MLAAVRTSTWTNAVAFFTELVSKPCPKALDEGETRYFCLYDFMPISYAKFPLPCSDTSSWAAQCSCVLELARECLAMAPSLAPDTLTSILLELIRSQGPIVITCSLLTSCGLPADAVATTASAVGRPLLSWLQGLTASVPCSMLQLQLVCEALEVWFFLFEDLETMSPSILVSNKLRLRII